MRASQFYLSTLKEAPAEADAVVADPGIKVTVVGRPNVGKSTLVNRLLGEERVVASDLPGTTRDSIHIRYERHGKPYTLIDTAGIRRRRSGDERKEDERCLAAGPHGLP